MRLLLIEDDPLIASAVRLGLTRAGFIVDRVADGRDAQAAIANAVYDAAVLDLGLPRVDGLSVLQQMRAKGNTMPVLIVSARDAVPQRIAGLNAGADDYLAKPFDLDELVARVHALLRRHSGSPSSVKTAGDLSLDPVRRLVTLRGREIQLTAKEFSLLEALMQHPGAVLSREQLEDSLYGWGDEVASNAVEVHLHNLRRKLGSESIRNVRGVGYRVPE